jgi:hypothetical protein
MGLMLLVGWPTVIATIAFVGGWRRLAERFPDRPSIGGDKYAFQSVQLSLLGSYSNCVNVTVSDAGLQLVPMILFRWFHPPIMTPWAVISTCERRDFLFSKRMRITIGNPPREKIDISGTVVLAIERAWQRAKQRPVS